MEPLIKRTCTPELIINRIQTLNNGKLQVATCSKENMIPMNWYTVKLAQETTSVERPLPANGHYFPSVTILLFLFYVFVYSCSFSILVNVHHEGNPLLASVVPNRNNSP